MAEEKPAKKKRPRAARVGTLPLDVKSLECMFRKTYRRLLRRGTHIKERREVRDGKARRGFQSLFDLRSKIWHAIIEKDPVRAMRLAKEFKLTIPAPEGGAS